MTPWGKTRRAPRHAGAALGLAALIALPASLAQPMGRAPETLNLSFGAEAYRAWPVVYAFSINGSANVAPKRVRCCLGDAGSRGVGSGSGIMGFDAGFDTGGGSDIAVDVIWTEVHSNQTFRGNISFSTDDIDGWTGGTIYLQYSFRPGGELLVYTDGPALAATRPGADLDIRNGADMRAVLTAPGLGRPLQREDFTVLARLCGTPEPDPPEGLSDGRAAFPPGALQTVDAERNLPLPASKCDRG
ncbi:MAG: hypothetical protein AAGM21_05000 [Pseudomonadota bacterium]